MNISDLQQIEAVIKQAAKKYILPRYELVTPGYKDDGSLITEVDLDVQNAIQSELNKLYPEIEMLGEEMTEQQHLDLFNNNQNGIWCLDPLDGTRNFSSGVPFFSVSLALIIDKEIRLGIVYDPVRDECFSAIKGQGAYINGKQLKTPEVNYPFDQTTAVVDFKRLPAALAQKIALTPPYSSQRSLGSVALDWCYLATARCHLYVHGKQNLWDFAAGYLVFHEARPDKASYACTLDGEDVYNRTLAKRSAVLAVNESLYKQWTKFLEIN